MNAFYSAYIRTKLSCSAGVDFSFKVSAAEGLRCLKAHTWRRCFLLPRQLPRDIATEFSPRSGSANDDYVHRRLHAELPAQLRAGRHVQLLHERLSCDVRVSHFCFSVFYESFRTPSVTHPHTLMITFRSPVLPLKQNRRWLVKKVSLDVETTYIGSRLRGRFG